MIFSNNEQRSEGWYQDRLGKWTASFFDKAITSTGKRSSSADEVNNRLVAETILGKPDETFQSEAMQRGSELEDEALAFINFTHGYNFKKVGFIDSGEGYGCSVDAWDDELKIGLEMKIPSAHTHLAYLAGKVLPKKHTQQVQGGMMITDAKKWVFMSYHPEIPSLVIEVDRDESFIRDMRAIIKECCLEIKERLAELNEILKAS